MAVAQAGIYYSVWWAVGFDALASKCPQSFGTEAWKCLLNTTEEEAGTPAARFVYPAANFALNMALIHSCSLDGGIMSLNVCKRVDIQLWDQDAAGTVPTGPAERSNRKALMHSVWNS